MGFITNADDERVLNDSANRTRLMDGVADAIEQYFNQETQLALN